MQLQPCRLVEMRLVWSWPTLDPYAPLHFLLDKNVHVVMRWKSMRKVSALHIKSL